MPKFAANLSLLFADLPLSERFAASKAAGFNAVEIQFPYEMHAEEMAALLQAHDLQMVLHNLPAGNWPQGERGIACLPQRMDEFRAGVETALHYAKVLGVRQLNCLAGIRPDDLDPVQSHACLLDNVRYAAQRLQKEGMRLLLEPINTFDIPGFFLSRPSQGFALLKEAAQPNAYLQYDIYHAQRMEGELAITLCEHLAEIGHIQIADNPGRHQPGTGEIAYPYLFNLLDQLGYRGFVGCEYLQQGSTQESLAWCAAWLQTPPS